MLVNYIFRRYKDQYFLSNLDSAPLTWTLTKQSDCADYLPFSSGIINPNTNNIQIDFPTDGDYNLYLVRGNQFDFANISIRNYLRLQKGLIFNLKQALCGDPCNTCKDCLGQGLDDCVSYQGLFGQLLGYQYLIKPYTTDYCDSNCLMDSYISQALELNKCTVNYELYAQLCGESLTGKIENSKQLILYIAAIYYLVYYFYERLTAADLEEQIYVDNKFYWQYVQKCILKQGINIYQIKDLFTSISQVCNTAPTVSSITRNFQDETPEDDNKTYTFIRADFTTGFADLNGDNPKTVKILSNTFRGQLYWDGLLINGDNYTFDISDVERLSYHFIIQETEPIFDKIFFQISDDNATPKYSNMASIAIAVTAYVNQPPSEVGDNSFTISNRTTKVFTMSDFTTGTTPPYHDPEGDGVEALRIDSLPVLGTLVLVNVPCTLNQIIPASAIVSGSFKFVPPDQNPSASANFNFSLSDTGSHTFVS